MNRPTLTSFRVLLSLALTAFAGNASAAIHCGMRHVERFAQGTDAVAHTQVGHHG